MKIIIYLSFLYFLVACNSQKQELLNENFVNKFIIASICICDTLSQSHIEKAIIQFTDRVSIEQNAKVFKVLISRRYNYTRINVFPTKFYYEFENDLPCSYKEHKDYILLFYNGTEQLVVPDSNYQKKILAKLSKLTKKELSLYNPPIFQIDFYRKDSMVVNLPPINPWDYNFPPPETIYDFSPPKKKKKHIN